jgi:hypothetical protein
MKFLPENCIIAEIGTQEGQFARKLYDSLKPAELHLFDINLGRFTLTKRSNPVTSAFICIAAIVLLYLGGLKTSF